MIVFIYILSLFMVGFTAYQWGEINTYKHVNKELKKLKKESKNGL